MYVFIAKSKSYTEYRKIGRSKKKENRKRKGKYTQSLLLGKMHLSDIRNVQKHLL